MVQENAGRPKLVKKTFTCNLIKQNQNKSNTQYLITEPDKFQHGG